MLEAILGFIAEAEVKHEIPRGLLTAICKVESGLNPRAVRGQDGAGGHASLGLCQVQMRTAGWVCGTKDSKELLDARKNADCAGKYLAYQFKRYGDWDGATIAYNKGSWSGGRTNVYLRKVQSVRSH